MRRWLIHIAVSLILGLVTTVSVAVLAIYSTSTTVGQGETKLIHADAWRIVHRRTVLFEEIVANLDSLSPSVSAGFPETNWIAWWMSELPVLEEPGRSIQRVELVLGRPFFAIRAGFDTATELSTGKVLYDRPIGGDQPFHLMWSGLFADVATFSFVWLTLIRARRSIRYAGRRRRGRCLHCGYDLRGATTAMCSECGREQTEMRAAAKRSRRIYGVIGVMVAAVVAIPLAQAWNRHREFIASGGWLEEYLSNPPSIMDDGYREQSERVHLIDGHENVIADRLTNATPEEAEEIGFLLLELCAIEPRESYLALIEETAAREPVGERSRALMAYANYPLPQVRDRVLSMLDDLDDRDVTNTVVFIVQMSSHLFPEEAEQAGADEVLMSVLDDSPYGRARLRALYSLLSRDWIGHSEAEPYLQEILEDEPELTNDGFYEDVLEIMAEKAGG